jgi:hypothetical protein
MARSVLECASPLALLGWTPRENCGVAVCWFGVILMAMSTVQEIEAALLNLSRAEIEEVRTWIDGFLEDQLELTDEVKTKLDQSRREIAEGCYATRQPR